MPKGRSKGRTKAEKHKLDEYTFRVIFGWMKQLSRIKGPITNDELNELYKNWLERYTMVPAKRALGKIEGLRAKGEWNQQAQFAFEKNNLGLLSDIERVLGKKKFEIWRKSYNE